MVTIPQPVESMLGLGPGEIVEQAEKTLGRSMLLCTARFRNCGSKVQDALRERLVERVATVIAWVASIRQIPT